MRLDSLSSNSCTIVVMIETVERTSWETDVCRIEADVAEVAGVLNAAHGRLVELAGELIETEAWRRVGIKSVEHWLCWRAGLSAHRAKQVVGVARRRAELPVICATLARGERSLEQVGEVARFVPTHNDAEAAGLAKAATVSQLHNTLSRYRFANTVLRLHAEQVGLDADDVPVLADRLWQRC